MTVQRYQMEVEAMRVQKPYKTVVEWCGGTLIKGFGGTVLYIAFPGKKGGNQMAKVGEYIVRDAEGWFYACKEERFAKIFRQVPS